MDTKVDMLKEVALKATTETDIKKIPGNTVVDVLDFIGKNYKETAGARGPAGPAGPAGPKGDKGDTGAAGKNGADAKTISKITVDETTAKTTVEGNNNVKTSSAVITFSDNTTSTIQFITKTAKA